MSNARTTPNSSAGRAEAGQPRAYLGFLHDLDEEHVVLHGVDDDEHVPEVGGDDAPAVVARVLRPHDVNLVVPQVAELQTANWLFINPSDNRAAPGVTARKLNYNAP